MAYAVHSARMSKVSTVILRLGHARPDVVIGRDRIYSCLELSYYRPKALFTKVWSPDI